MIGNFEDFEKFKIVEQYLSFLLKKDLNIKHTAAKIPEIFHVEKKAC